MTLNKLVRVYIKLVRETSKLPTFKEFTAIVNLQELKEHFDNFNDFSLYVRENYDDQISKYVLSEHNIFTKKKLDQLSSDIGKYKKFVITTAVNNKKVFKPFYNSIKNYCTRNNAKLLLIPCADIFSKFKTENYWNFDPLLKNETFVFKDAKLNDNLFICSIKMSAKHINPTVGLYRIAQNYGSYIFASPKQDLEYSVSSPYNNKIPSAMMTTGAITVADYETDRYMSERVSYIAENDHIMGAIIVEIQDDKIFHFRQIQAAENGSFIDMGIMYNQKSVKNVNTHIVLGDWHSGETDPVVKKATEKLCKKLNVKNAFVHDIFNGTSISHHDYEDSVKMAKQELLLEDELQIVGKELNDIGSWIQDKIYVVKSNHDLWINQYLRNNDYAEDSQNQYLACDLWRQLHDNIDPLKYGVEVYGGLKNKNKVYWFGIDEPFSIGGVYLSAHGHVGKSGKRNPTLKELEKAYSSCIVGHIHSGAIYKKVFRVGKSTGRLPYQVGPDTNTSTHCLLYDNGMRQLINIIDGNFCV